MRFVEDAEEGNLPRIRLIATCPLFGSRGKVSALEKQRVSSPSPQKVVGGEHRAIESARGHDVLVPRRVRPEGPKTIFWQKSIILKEIRQRLVHIPVRRTEVWVKVTLESDRDLVLGFG